MRVLLIHQYFLEEDDPGGSRFNEMTKVWSDMGHEVTVIAGMMHANASEKRAEYRGKTFSKKQQGDVEVLRCHVSESYNKNFLGRLWGYFSFVFTATYAGWFKTKGTYDVILASSPPLFVGLIAYFIALIKQIPIVFEVRDLWPESAIDTGVLKNKVLIKMAYALESFIYKKARLINVLTPAFEKKLVNEKGIFGEKVICIPNAADFLLAEEVMADFDPDSFKQMHQLQHHFVITYVGAHGVANHLIQLLDVAERLRDTRVLFQLIGDGMNKEKLVTEARNRNLENVRFVDPVPKAEVFQYILASDMGASVLKNVDTFKTIYSNKTFDYMSCKTPILLCIDGVSRELVETANCGLYAEPENIDEIERVIRLALEMDPKELDKMGENGYKYAKEHFDRKKLAKEYMEHIEKAI